MRIAVLSRNFASTGGGAERYSMAVVEQLATRHEVHVFAQTIAPEAHAIPGVQYHLVAMPMARPRWINQLYFAWATWHATRKGFDVVHSHENTWHGQVQTVHVLPIKHTLFAGRTGLAKALRWLKVLISPRLLAYLWLEKSRYRPNPKRRVVVTSGTLKQVMEKTYPESAAMLEVVLPGVAQAPGLASAAEQQAARAQLGLPQSGRCVLLVGNDFRKKGLPTLLQALPLLSQDVFVVVVGQSAQLAEMRQLALGQGVATRVHFVGALTDMEPAYRSANWLAHPTLEDTYAMVVLEACAHGLPVVVSGPAYCGISADLTHGVNALLLDDPRSAAGLAEAINRCANDAALAATLSANARTFAQQHTWAQAAQAYDSLFTTVTQTAKARWLVLSHAFNMDGRAASQTITDKLPHLEKAGVELVILSGVSGRKDAHYEHHQLWPAGPAGIRFELRHVLRKRLGSGFLYRVPMGLASLLLLPGMLVEKLLWPVESSWSWWLSAYCKGLGLGRKKKFDLIYSTGGAFGAHIAAKHLKDALQVPWMAEVHDPLVEPEWPANVPLSAQQKMQGKVEGLICTHADAAIWFTDAALAAAGQRHPQLGDKGHMLLPGIDAPPEVLPHYEAGEKMVIGHFGSLSATRNLLPVLGALERLQAQYPDAANKVELHVYGGPLDSVSAQALASSTVRTSVRHFGRIEADPVTGLSGREQILRRMRKADVLLLLHGLDAMCAQYIPSKLYEYLWMQRPILALVHNNPQMLALVRAQGHTAIPTGGVASHDVETALESALATLFEQWRSGGLPDRAAHSPYTTANAVRQVLQWSQNLSTQAEVN